MTTPITIHHHDTIERPADTRPPDPHQDTYSRTVLGFWMYLMTDCLLFGSLFATYAVLHNETFGGPSSQDLFSLPLAFTETMILLCSSVTCGFAILAAVRSERKAIIGWLFATFVLGISFIAIELTEFTEFVHAGHDWTQSAFLSAFFTLVGTHGLHVATGLLWLVVMIAQVYYMGVTLITFRRLVIFSLFWHFLDLVWIFLFTFVYLMGAI